MVFPIVASQAGTDRGDGLRIRPVPCARDLLCYPSLNSGLTLCQGFGGEPREMSARRTDHGSQVRHPGRAGSLVSGATERVRSPPTFHPSGTACVVGRAAQPYGGRKGRPAFLPLEGPHPFALRPAWGEAGDDAWGEADSIRADFACEPP